MQIYLYVQSFVISETVQVLSLEDDQCIPRSQCNGWWWPGDANIQKDNSFNFAYFIIDHYHNV